MIKHVLQPRLLLALLLLSSIRFVANAQLVADGDTLTINGSSTNVAGNLIVGNTGSFTALIAINGGTITNSGAGTVGNLITSKTNRVIVAGTNSVWANAAALNIGSAGAFNLLVVSNAGRAVSSFGNLGNSTGGSNNTAVVTGTNSLWTITSALNVGNVESANQLIVSNGARVVASVARLGNSSASARNLAIFNGSNSSLNLSAEFDVGRDSSFNQVFVTNGATVVSSGGYLGGNPTAFSSGASNLVVVAGTGSAWINSSVLGLGYQGSGNRLVISNGGAAVITSASGDITLGNQINSLNNAIVLADTNSLLSHPSKLAIGSRGSSNSITVRDGARVQSGSVSIGDTADGSNNLAVVTGPGALLTNATGLFVGNTGPANQLLVNNSGTVRGPTLLLGVSFTSSSNLVTVSDGNLIITNAAGVGVTDVRRGILRFVGGNLVTDYLFSTNSGGGLSNSVFLFNHGNLTTLHGSDIRHTDNFEIGGTGGQTASWTIAGGTNLVTVGNFQSTYLSHFGGQRGVVTVTGASTVWSNSGPLHVGYGGSSNQMFILNGANVISPGGYLGTSIFTTDNEVWINGPGSRWTCLNNLTVGNFGVNSRLIITNGGWLVSPASPFIGSGNIAPSNNVVLVTGVGSVWSNSATIYVGWGSSSNTIAVSSNGLLNATGVSVSALNFTSNNVLTVVEGTVVVTNASTTGVLEAGPAGQGAINFNAGLIHADRLLVTNGTKSIFIFSGGTLQTAGMMHNNGSTCVVGNGSSVATLEFLENRTHTFSNGLSINSNAQLKGNGTIIGSLSVQGLLSPGASIGKLTVNGALTCLSGSTNFFELDKSAGTNDNLTATGNIGYAGTLVATNLSGTLAVGDSFKLFTGPSYSGSFVNLLLPALGPGLQWTNMLSVDGSLMVITAPFPRDFGLDLSHFQGETGVSQSTWNQMFSEGKRFAFIKATEALSVTDAAMPNNVARATAAGLRAGVYHFAHPESRPTTSGAIQEADFFLSTAGNFIGPGYLRPVLDLETGSGLSTSNLTDWVIAFANEIITNRGHGAAPIIYTLQGFANNELDSRVAGYDLWIRTVGTGANPASADPPGQGYPTATGVFNNWSFWQYSDTGNSGGISPLDLNVCHSDFKLLDSFLIPAMTNPAVPSIVSQPQSRTINVSNSATFSVAVSVGSTPPLAYQWRFNGTNIGGATANAFTRASAQLADAGAYTVVVSNPAGSVTSAVATLTINIPPPPIPGIVLYQENFDEYSVPSIVSSPATTNGFKIFFNATSGPFDFSTRFGFDYSAVVSPTTIPSAPHSTGGTTKGLYLTVNKDGTPAITAVNLYPVSQVFTGNFVLKLDLWINYPNTGTATEHALFGINHSATITNRVGLVSSDGLYFAVDGDSGAPAGSTAIRDFAIFQGGGPTFAPLLLTTNNTIFGPAPLLGPQFDGPDSGFAGLFPSKALPGFTTTPGTAGNGWVAVEVRQIDNLITWLLNDTIVAQFTNPSAFLGGDILIGYDDNFTSVGGADNFAVFDNIRVETVPDADGNGLPDSWENQFFGQTGVDLFADADGDGMSNYQEYQAGTNPTNAASAFRMISATRTNNDVVLNWTAVGGHSYVVQIQTNLGTGFVDLAPVIPVAGSSETVTNYVQANGATNSRSYYRVRIQ